MTTEHTPGPWHSTGPNVRTEDGELLGTFTSDGGNMFPRDANARLAAAATLQHETLIRVEEWLSHSDNYSYDSLLRCEVRAAIAAASTD